MTTSQKNFDTLLDLSKHVRILKGISQHLEWDQETYMPKGSSGIRAQQIETLAGIIHKEKTSKKFHDHLNKLIDVESGEVIAKDLSDAQQAALKLWRKDYLQGVKLPSAFVEEFARVASQSSQVWQLAKSEDRYQLFAPFLDKIVSLNRQKADYLGFEEHPYDALLDEYEPGFKTSEVDRLFQELRKELIPLVKKISSQHIDDSFLFGEWNHDLQLKFGKMILEHMGYDFSKGRVDLSSHPFSCSTHPTDSRITTRIHSESLMSNIFVLLHEGGHSLYEMGLPQEHYGSPLGDAQSLGLHESQSRWWETRIGMSESFWRYYFPLLKETFKGRLDSISFEQFYKAINKVEPSLIRVEADELTYPLHVILRFEIEKGLIEGSLNVRDLPEIWNAKMEHYLGIIPKTNREGCLQDVHWAWGSFGYFPTYTLGNMYASHLFKGFEKQQPNWAEKVASGELEFIKNWLDEKVYKHGRRYETNELLKLATGHHFSADAYIEYLKKKYGAIYKL